ncbi:MAG: MCE family protein [Gammaproteobacteria bacterium]|nr:MCE family protein [Gammaproteobacteria bacterium]
MRDDRINYVAVGAFVLVVLCGLVLSLALLTGKTGTRDRYYTIFNDVTGLKYGSQVLYMGYPVGQVEFIEPEVQPDGIRFKLTLSVDTAFAGWQVPKDSVAQVRAAGLLAAKSIDIRAGRAGNPLQPGDTMTGIANVDPFSAMTDTANTVRHIAEHTVAPLVENLKRYIDTVGVALENHGANVIENVADITDELARRTPALIDDVMLTSAELRAATGTVRKVLSDDNADKVGLALDNVLAMSEDAALLVAKLRIEADEFSARMLMSAGNLEQLTRDAHLGVGRILSEESATQIKTIIDNVHAITDRLAVTVPTLSERLEGMLKPRYAEQLDTVMANLESASVELEVLMRDSRGQLDRLLGDRTADKVELALGNVAEASAAVAELSGNLNSRLGTLLTETTVQKVQGALDGFSQAAVNVAALSTRLKSSTGKLDTLLVALNETVGENRPALRRSIQDLQHTLGVLATHVDSLTRDLEGTSRNMYEFSRAIKQNPGLLLRGTTVSDERIRTAQ